MFNASAGCTAPTRARSSRRQRRARGPPLIAWARDPRARSRTRGCSEPHVLENLMIGAHTSGPLLCASRRLRFNVARRGPANCSDGRSVVLSELASISRAPPGAGLSYGTLKRVETRKSHGVASAPPPTRRTVSGLTHAEVDELATTIRLCATASTHDPARRAPHADGDGHQRQGRGARFRTQIAEGTLPTCATTPTSSRPTSEHPTHEPPRRQRPSPRATAPGPSCTVST